MRLPTSEYLRTLQIEDRLLLGAFYDEFSSHTWFTEASIVNNHPTTFAKTLVLQVEYSPTMFLVILAEWCKEHEIKYILQLPQDSDCLPKNVTTYGSEITTHDLVGA